MAPLLGHMMSTCPAGIEYSELSSQFGPSVLFAVVMACSSWFCKTSHPHILLNFVPTNAALGLNVLQDYDHPRTAVVGAGTSWLWTPGFKNKKWIFLDSTRAQFYSLGSQSTIIGLLRNKVLISFHNMVFLVLR